MTPIRLQHSRGFTMLEILVSLGIAVVLAILIFAGINTVREASERAKCAGNLRQIGSAIHQYAVDNGGWLPPGYRSSMGGSFGKILSAGYLEPMRTVTMAADVLYCPANVRLGSPPAGGYANGYKGWSGYFFGYLLNASLFLITNSNIGNAAYVSDVESRVKLVNVRHPSQIVALQDMPTRALGVSGPPTTGLTRNTYFNPEHPQFSLGTIHFNTGNILFLDGHVVAFQKKKLPVMSLPDQETAWWP